MSIMIFVRGSITVAFCCITLTQGSVAFGQTDSSVEDGSVSSIPEQGLLAWINRGDGLRPIEEVHDIELEMLRAVRERLANQDRIAGEQAQETALALLREQQARREQLVRTVMMAAQDIGDMRSAYAQEGFLDRVVSSLKSGFHHGNYQALMHSYEFGRLVQFFRAIYPDDVAAVLARVSLMKAHPDVLTNYQRASLSEQDQACLQAYILPQEIAP